MASPRNPPADSLGAVRWNPEELELDGAPFGGPPSAYAGGSHNEPAHVTPQLALDEAFSQGFEAGREAGATGAPPPRRRNAHASRARTRL